jgi:hypothetical protein
VANVCNQTTQGTTNQIKGNKGTDSTEAEEDEKDGEDEGFHEYIIVRFCLLFGEVTNFRRKNPKLNIFKFEVKFHRRFT